MRTRFHFANYGFITLAAVAIAACNADRTTAPRDRHIQTRGPNAEMVDLTSTPPLYTQVATSEDNFGHGGTGDFTYLADDFIVPSGSVWTVTNVAITGVLHYWYLPFSIRYDANGHPGAPVPNADVSVDFSASDDSPFGVYDFLFPLPTAVTLPAGKYWLVIESGNGVIGTSLWQLRDQVNSAGLVSMDHGTTWQPSGHDYAFGVFGSATITQTITLTPVTPNPAPIGSTAAVVASASSGLTVALAAGPASVCSLAGTTLSFVGIGKCTLQANQAGNATYLPAAEVTQDINVTKRSQTITFPAITPNPAPPSSSATLGASASSGLAVSYSSLTTSVCTVSGTTVSYVNAGSCTVAANQAGNATYDPATQATQSVDVSKNTQTITFTSTPPAPGYVNGTYTAGTTGGASGKPVVITAATPNVCTVNTNVVTFVGVGTCTVTANQTGNSAYDAAAPVSQDVKVAYRFEGFLDPVKNGDVMNTAKAGQAIALKWRLTDANGAAITSLAMPRTTVDDLNCALGTTTDQSVEQAAGGSGLQNLGNGYYQYNWKSPASYAKSCKVLQLDLGEGAGARVAKFAFTK